MKLLCIILLFLFEKLVDGKYYDSSEHEYDSLFPSRWSNEKKTSPKPVYADDEDYPKFYTSHWSKQREREKSSTTTTPEETIFVKEATTLNVNTPTAKPASQLSSRSLIDTSTVDTTKKLKSVFATKVIFQAQPVRPADEAVSNSQTVYYYNK